MLDELIGAGLPAAQRPYRLRTQVVQQVVLGPFPTREEALAALQRLRVMGGYADAHVIGFAAAESTQ